MMRVLLTPMVVVPICLVFFVFVSVVVVVIKATINRGARKLATVTQPNQLNLINARIKKGAYLRPTMTQSNWRNCLVVIDLSLVVFVCCSWYILAGNTMSVTVNQTIIGLNFCNFRGIGILICLLQSTMVPLLWSAVTVLSPAVGAALVFFLFFSSVWFFMVKIIPATFMTGPYVKLVLAKLPNLSKTVNGF